LRRRRGEGLVVGDERDGLADGLDTGHCGQPHGALVVREGCKRERRIRRRVDRCSDAPMRITKMNLRQFAVLVLASLLAVLSIAWVAGDTSPKTITIGPAVAAGAYIPIINDATIEGPETFTVTLTSASGATLGAQKTAQVTILSEETGLSMISATASGLESAG